jgi:hypothetical protein
MKEMLDRRKTKFDRSLGKTEIVSVYPAFLDKIRTVHFVWKGKILSIILFLLNLGLAIGNCTLEIQINIISGDRIHFSSRADYIVHDGRTSR